MPTHHPLVLEALARPALHPADEPAHAAAAATPLQRDRTLARVGAPPGNTADRWTDTHPETSPRDVEDIEMLERRFPAPPPPRRARELLARLGPLGLVTGTEQALVIDPHALVAAAALRCATSDSAALAAAGTPSPGALRALRTLAGSQALATRPPRPDAPLAALDAWAAAAAAALSADDVAAAAQRARARWLSAALRDVPHLLPEALVDPAPAAVLIDRLNPAPLLASDEAVLIASLPVGGQRPPLPDIVLARAAAWCATVEASLAIGSAVDRLGLTASVAALRSRDDDPAPLGADAVRAALLDSVDARGLGALTLVDPPDVPDWRWVARAAGDPDRVEAEVARLLDLPTDWADFDAPGEGTLPQLWLDILAVAGHGHSATARRLADVTEATPDSPDVALGRYPAPARAAELRDAAASLDGGSSQGAPGAIDEAYGGGAPPDVLAFSRPQRK
ncbi:MAG: hypothetical protein H6698_00855 [Myxococcales bacterium]|nr:hypothetical protein [Myxococcales bacterium]